MEILNKNVALLSNCEVYTLLKQTKEELANKLAKKKNLKDSSSLELNVDKHLSTIVYESLRYLEKTPCALQNTLAVSEFLKKFDDPNNIFKLTKIEKLQLLNQRPSSAVELQCIIGDSEERFTLEQMDDLLEFIHSNLPVNSESIEEADNHQETENNH
jgi:hypothetical protein